MCSNEILKIQQICLNNRLSIEETITSFTNCAYSFPLPSYNNSTLNQQNPCSAVCCDGPDSDDNMKAYYYFDLICVNRPADISINKIDDYCWNVVYLDSGNYLLNIIVKIRDGRDINAQSGYCFPQFNKDTTYILSCGVESIWQSFVVQVKDSYSCNNYVTDSCNFIKNGGFDDYTTCPTEADKYGVNINYLQDWNYATSQNNWYDPGIHHDCGDFFGEYEYTFPDQPLPSGGGYVRFLSRDGLGQKVDLCPNQKYEYGAYIMKGGKSTSTPSGSFVISGVNTVNFPTSNTITPLSQISGSLINLYYDWTYFTNTFTTSTSYNGITIKSSPGSPIFVDNLHLKPVDTVIFSTQLISNRCDSAEMLLNIPGCYGPYDLAVVVNQDTIQFVQIQDGYTVRIPLAQNNIVKVLSITNSLGCATILNSSDTLVVNNGGNADFSSSDFCEGQTNIITFLADTGTFSLVNNTTGAIINPNTGIITGASGNQTFIIRHIVCVDTVYDTIRSLASSAAFTSTNICVGGTNVVNISGTTGGIFSLVPPTNGATININTGVISGGIVGNNYTIKYVVNGMCPDSTTQTIQVVAIEDPSFVATNFCINGNNTITITGTPNGTFSFSPLPSDGATINSSTGIISNATVGNSYRIKYVTPGTCSDSSYQTVVCNNNPTVAISGGVGDLCVDDSVKIDITLTGIAPWSVGFRESNNAPTFYNITMPTHSFWVDSIGDYWISSVQDSNKCFSDPDSTIVKVKGDSILVFADADTSCVPATVMFTTNYTGSAGDCLWNFGDGSSINLCDTVYHTYSYAGSFSIYLNVSSSKCLATFNQQNFVFVADTPKANFYVIPQRPTVVNNTVSITNTSVDNLINEWFLNNGYVTGIINPSLALPASVGQNLICLQVENQFTCKDTTCIKVDVFDESLIYIPNAFNPNKDGLNELFLPVLSNVQFYKLQLFNRWGQLLFETEDVLEGWNGTFKGDDCRAGVYTYKMTYRFKGNYDDQYLTGHFTLLR